MEDLCNIFCFKNLNNSETVENWTRWSGWGRNRLDYLHHKERKRKRKITRKKEEQKQDKNNNK